MSRGVTWPPAILIQYLKLFLEDIWSLVLSDVLLFLEMETETNALMSLRENISSAILRYSAAF